MKRLIILIIGGALCFCGCKNAPKSSILTEDEYRKSLQESGLIAVPADFMPTMELTDEIRESSLEDLIIHNRGKYSKNEEKRREKYIQEQVDMARQRALMEGRRFTKKEEQAIRELEALLERPISPSEMALNASVTIKHVPQNSNIAKVFYMENKEMFIFYNMDYYNRVKDKQRFSSREEREKAAQEKWKEYN